MRRMNTSHFIACGVLAGGIWPGSTRPEAQSVATVRRCERAADGQGRRARRPDGDCPRREDRVDRSPAAKAQIPAGAVRIDGKGKFLMPGLAEMHAHIPGGKAPDAAVERTLFLYVANGITTIRGMLGDPRHLGLSRARREGRDRQPAHLHVGSVVQRQDGVDEGDGRRDGHRAEEGRLRPAEDSPRRAARRVRRAGGQGRRTEDPVCRPCAGATSACTGRSRRSTASIDHLDGYVEALANEPAAPSQFFGTQPDERRSTSRGFRRSSRRRRRRGSGRFRRRSCWTAC